MASQLLHLLLLAALLTLLVSMGVSADRRSLHKVLRKRDVAGAATGPSKSSVAVPPSKAQEFLAKLSRTKRNIWDRSLPDVQQWIMQFMYMGFDEQKSCSRSNWNRRLLYASCCENLQRKKRLETDLSYWMDHARSNDHGRQHHYDENAPIGPRDPSSYRHGANVNYDYY